MSRCISGHGEFGEHDLDQDHVCRRCAVLDEDALVAELSRLQAELAEAQKRANEAARLSAAARDESDDLRKQIGDLNEHIGIVEGDRLELQEQRHFVLTLCDDAEQVVGRAGFLRVDAIREALDAAAGTSTVSLRFEASSAEWSLRERDIIEAAKAWRADKAADPQQWFQRSPQEVALSHAVDALAAEQSTPEDAARDGEGAWPLSADDEIAEREFGRLNDEVMRAWRNVRTLSAQRDKVLALHTDFEGRCTACVEYCECPDENVCTHGNVEWPCPTAAIYAGSRAGQAGQEVAGT